MTSIRKRSWLTPDGSSKTAWLVDYRDQGGKRRAKQFTRKKDAEQWAVKAGGELLRGVHTPDSCSITVYEAAELWLDSVRAHGREPTTVASYDQHVRLHIGPKCGARRLSQLTAPEVKGFLDQWLQELSRPMAVRVLRSLKAILAEAQERGLVAQNVAQAVKPRKLARQKGKAAVPSKAELRSILKAAECSADLRGRAIVELAIFTGMRASELRGSSWRTVDLRGAKVRVEQRADARGVIGPPKSAAGHRTVPLPARTVSVLKKWKLASNPGPSNLVFPSEKGKPMAYRVMLMNHVGPILVAAGVADPIAPKSEFANQEIDLKPRYSMHAFRHAAASLWIEQGLDAKRVQSLMGHGSIQVTFDTYGHLFDQRRRDADDAAAIERALFADAT